jgi:hypothetical protein
LPGARYLKRDVIEDEAWGERSRDRLCDVSVGSCQSCSHARDWSLSTDQHHLDNLLSITIVIVIIKKASCFLMNTFHPS